MDLINCNVKRVVLPICSVVKFTTYPRAPLTILKTCGLFKLGFEYPIQIHTRELLQRAIKKRVYPDVFAENTNRFCIRGA